MKWKTAIASRLRLVRVAAMALVLAPEGRAVTVIGDRIIAGAAGVRAGMDMVRACTTAAVRDAPGAETMGMVRVMVQGMVPAAAGDARGAKGLATCLGAAHRKS